MPQTFGDCWRFVRLQVPGAGAMLVQHWVQHAYNRLCSARGWSWLRAETILTTLAMVTPLVTVTQGSITVTSVGLFTANMAGRQFRIGNIPIYTVATVIDADTITLDQPYAGISRTVACQILNAYCITPADFGRFLTIVDPTFQRQIPFWISEEQLNLADPQRYGTASVARALVSKKLGTVASNLNRVLYEWYPYPTTALAFPALYIKSPPALAEDTPLQGVLDGRGDVLEMGALALAARWPGTAEVPNPMFNLELAQDYQAQFIDGLGQLATSDDDQYSQDWSTLPWRDFPGLGVTDSGLLRASDGDAAGDSF